MRRYLQISFEKFHGLGNDFIVVRGHGLPASLPRFARALLDRHTGVGGDGLVVALPPKSRKNNARVRFFNADGSEAEMSGNGIRCVAAFFDGGAATPKSRSDQPLLRIETIAGVRTIDLVKRERDRWTFRVGMGLPVLEPARIPFKAGDFPPPIVAFPLATQRGPMSATVTSMGNPHCTVQVDDFASVDWASLGSEIERHELFPRRTNVEFVKVISRNEIEVRFWERGVGETASSGTGSCSAVVACILNGLTERSVRVQTLAGTLDVAWPKNGEVTLAGPVVRVAAGTFYYRE